MMWMLVNDLNRRVISGVIVWERLVELRRSGGAVEIRFCTSEKSGIHSIVRLRFGVTPPTSDACSF
jgi:hypothetical protein